MIKIKNDKIEIKGELFDVLAELGAIIRVMNLKIPREMIINAFIIGLLEKEDD